ncbi:mucin-like protein [Cryptosporidium canis]|nr:mucin-like protein [Cryptosporidium canis]
MFLLKGIIISLCVVGIFLINSIESRGYRESRINKVIKVETFSKKLNRSSENDTCMNNLLQVSNFMNTGRWRRIRNKLGTGWDDNLIPPLMFCVKILDKPTNTSNSCNRNNFDLTLSDGMNKSRNTIVVAKVSDVLKGEEKCIFISPCEILRHIYWGDNNFKNSIDNLEFRVNASFESSLPDQRFISMISIKGLARSLKRTKNPWDNHLKMVQRFKDVQALSLFIPYKSHSKSFVSDTCIVKPRVTSVFYGKDKPSLCKFNNCMWNIWIGQLSGEFVNERCTIGKASSRGDYIVGWFSPYAMDSETIGSMKLKIQWDSTEAHDEGVCSVSTEIEKKIVEYNKSNSIRGNLRSDWFPNNEEESKYETIYDFESTGTRTNTRSTETEIYNSKEVNVSEGAGDNSTSILILPSTTSTTTTTTTTTSTTTSTSTKLIAEQGSAIRPKISLIGPNGESKGMNMCIHGRCRSAHNLWSSLHPNSTRHLLNDGEFQSNVGDVQIEWIDVDKNSTKWDKDLDGTSNYNVDGSIENNVDDNTIVIQHESESTRIDGNKNTCSNHVCACMIQGSANEDITVVDAIDEIADNDLESSDFEKIENKMDHKIIFEKWLKLKSSYEN